MQYRYGMRLRGFSPGCQPMKNLVSREDDQTGRYHDILVYNRPLTDEEVRDYELDYIEKEQNGMAVSEAEKRAKTKYMKKVRQVMVKFNLETDEGELFQCVESHDNMQGYIKELIRKDIERRNTMSKTVTFTDEQALATIHALQTEIRETEVAMAEDTAPNDHEAMEKQFNHCKYLADIVSMISTAEAAE